MRHIEAIIADRGEITVGARRPHKCVAAAADQSNALATLVWCDGEALSALLQRLDQAIAKAYDDDGFTDEMNSTRT